MPATPMAARPAPPTALPQHPLQRSARRMYLLGGVYVVLGAGTMAVFHGAAVPGAAFALFGALLVALGVRQGRLGPAVMLNNAAHDLLTQGRYEEAMALLDTIPPARRTGLVGMAVLSQRAYVLFAQGDAAGAVALSAEALALRPPVLAGAPGRQYHTVLRANRALMLAAAGDAAGARAEAARVDAEPEALPLLRGLAALARAVTHARAGERAALVGELSRSRAVLDQLSGREATLVRTLGRLAAVPAGGAYRAPGSRDGSGLSDAARWVVSVVPQAAAFAPRAAEPAGPVDAGRLPAASDAARARVAADREAARKGAPDPARWTALIWGAATVALLAAFRFLEFAWLLTSAPWALAALLPALVAFMVWRHRRLDRLVREARALYADGRAAESDAKLERVAPAASHAHAAVALMDLAEHAERRDDLPGALARVDRALGRLLQSATVKASASDILLPALVALRARLLAAMDRTDEALAELEVLAREHPTFPFATGATLVVRVVVALRLGDRELARALARTRATDTRLARHAELLFDLLAGEAGWFEADGERERIEGELALNPGVRAWIERLAPGLTVTPATTRTGVRVADPGGAADPAALAYAPEEAAGVPPGAAREA